MRVPWPGSKPLPQKGFLTLPNLNSLDLFGPGPGTPMTVAIDLLDEDPDNPRTEFPARDIDELATDIAERGILQPIVVTRDEASGRYRIRFGAKRWRAARQAGLAQVPVTITATVHDAYDQVAENLKRHALSPLDLARFIRGRVDAGESNATIAKRLAIDLTTIAHHLSLLSLPRALAEAMTSGRCTSPRTLHELSRLHDETPGRVSDLLAGGGPITRNAVATIRDTAPVAAVAQASSPCRQPKGDRAAQMVQRANALCDRLDASFGRLFALGVGVSADDRAALRQRLAQLADRLG